MKSIVIAAPMSGSGKTTVTLGIMAWLKRRGLCVAPFKVGPDFIDPGWHRAATGRPSVNLDGWMCPADFVRETFVDHAHGSDIAVIEGVMGLFDGMGGSSDAGSTAQIAGILAAPVILVVDAKSQARSAAALISGFAGFDPQVGIAGVIFNNVGSDNHARILREAVASSCAAIRVLGCIPRDERLAIPSRHLGLLTVEDSLRQDELISHLAEVIGKHVDLEAILSLAGRTGPLPVPQKASPAPHPPPACGQKRPSARWPGKGGGDIMQTSSLPVGIAVARDRAFCFVYEDNLRLLREAGAELVAFSPLGDPSVPDGIGGIYLPGGYPELYAEELASNGTMISSIRQAIESGMPVYAECGGFVYLSRGVIADGNPIACSDAPGVSGGGGQLPEHEFVGIYPVATRMLPRRKALGYREIEVTAECSFAPRGTVARGHEFHYSEMEDMPESVERVYRVSRNGAELGAEGYRYQNCLASYIHLHFGSCPELPRAFVRSCNKFERGV